MCKSQNLEFGNGMRKMQRIGWEYKEWDGNSGNLHGNAGNLNGNTKNVGNQSGDSGNQDGNLSIAIKMI